MKPAYRLRPVIPVSVAAHGSSGYGSVKKLIKGFCVMETYPGFPTAELIAELRAEGYAGRIVQAEDFCPLSAKAFRSRLSEDLTDDRVFGRFTSRDYADFYDHDAIAAFVQGAEGEVLIVGIGASLFHRKNATLLYADMTRWSLQLSYRAGRPVFFKGGMEADNLQNFKRGYFAEWRMADRVKRRIWRQVDYFLAVDGKGTVSCVPAGDLHAAIREAVSQPFRLVPYFDAGVWGGQWMAKHLGLGTNERGNWAWGFDGVPEENSVVLRFAGGFEYEMPAINLVFFAAKELLGERVWSRFGAEFPIRFDMLDTVGGQNLSLQVHPTTDYMREHFGGQYTQEESYYILDTDANASPVCYLGLRDGTDSKDLLSAIRRAEQGEAFQPETYVNAFAARKHDHFLHPAGCVHSSGAGCMVLEISSTPYIFTFKLWDWNRVDFDGKPRPVNLARGKDVLQDAYDTTRCRAECVNAFRTLSNHKGVAEEHTGLHPNQFIEVRRWKIDPLKTAHLDCHNSFNMLNLVEGTEVMVSLGSAAESTRSFGYAETFIVPEQVKKYAVTNATDRPVMLLQAFVRV